MHSENLGFVLAGAERHAEALAAYQQVVERFRNDPEASIRHQVSLALYNKADSLRELGRATEAVHAYEELLVRLDQATPLDLFADALLRKANTLRELLRPAEALIAYDALIEHLQVAGDSQLPYQLASGRYNKAVLLDELRQLDAAKAAYRSFLENTPDSADAAITRIRRAAIRRLQQLQDPR